MIITIDGPGGSGKSTISRTLARRLGLQHLNSGFIYRAVTLLVLESGGAFDDHDKVAGLIQGMNLLFREDPDRTRVFIADRDVTDRLKDPDVTPQVYKVANDPFYRTLLVDLQRRCAAPPGVVAEGRDMGTVIFPHADFKYYLDATPEERARRQHRDLESRGHSQSYADVLAEVLDRDARERNRLVAPLRVPEGATVIHTDTLAVLEVVERILLQVTSGARGGAAT